MNVTAFYKRIYTAGNIYTEKVNFYQFSHVGAYFLQDILQRSVSIFRFLHYQRQYRNELLMIIVYKEHILKFGNWMISQTFKEIIKICLEYR